MIVFDGFTGSISITFILVLFFVIIHNLNSNSSEFDMRMWLLKIFALLSSNCDTNITFCKICGKGALCSYHFSFFLIAWRSFSGRPIHINKDIILINYSFKSMSFKVFLSFQYSIVQFQYFRVLMRNIFVIKRFQCFMHMT